MCLEFCPEDAGEQRRGKPEAGEKREERAAIGSGVRVYLSGF